MHTIHEALPLAQQLALAVRAHRPHSLARAFAQHAGQFYDRARFDQLARETRALYAVHDPSDADTFRAGLDARLTERDRSPVAWDHAA
jgi:hypothetical protein